MFPTIRPDPWIGLCSHSPTSFPATPLAAAETGLTLTGGTIMVGSVGAILTLVVWSYWKLLSGGQRDRRGE